MALFKIQILETLGIIAFYIISILVIKVIINNSLVKTQVEKTRRSIITKGLHLFVFITAFILLAGVWGLEQNEIAVYASTILTALGIAFFAQWSLLSNITSSIIIFFYHPLKIGDRIQILDKDYPIEGEIKELSYFFVYITTSNGAIITIPNSIVLQKSISLNSNKDIE